jgi:hypothetical protein
MAEKSTRSDAPANGFDPVSFVKHDAATAAMLSKTIPNNRVAHSRDEAGNRKQLLPQSYTFKTKLQRRAKRNNDAKMTLKLLPDIELAIQILISSILSPADMMTTELNYVGPDNVFTSELTGALITRLKTYFEQEYDVKALLPKMLRDILAEKGSYPIAVIPENVIDEFINGDKIMSMESLGSFVTEDGLPKNLGILGSPTENEKKRIRGISLEGFRPLRDPAQVDNRIHYLDNKTSVDTKDSYTKEEFVTVTDNLMVLKFNKLHDVIKKRNITKAVASRTNSYSFAFEHAESVKSKVSDLNVEHLIYRPRSFQSEQVASLKAQTEMKRKSVGNPLVIRFPSESILPVHVPGSVEKHIGYFVLLDEEGNPIESSGDDYYYSSASKGLDSQSRGSLGSNLISRVNTNIGSSNSFDPSNPNHLDYAGQVYADMVERDLIARIKNGIHSTNVQIASNEEIYRVMLARALSRKYTQILYIPIDYLTYMTFKYDDDGIGKSLLDDAATINTLRSVLMFSDTIASIKNSIGRTQVSMTLDEKDPNPMKTIEQAQEEIVRSRQLGIPLGITNPTDITDFIQRAGYEWTFEGHPGLPALKFDFQNNASSIPKPDTELQENLKKQSIMTMGLSPETVDNGFSGEFATTVVANNILLSKRIMQYQEQFSPAVSDHLRKFAIHSEKLVSELKELIIENKGQIKLEFDQGSAAIVNLSGEEREKLLVNKSLYEFLNGFEVMLPKPPSITLENQLAGLTTYIEALEKAIDAYVSADFMTETNAGSLSSNIDLIKAMIKSHFVRKYMAEKGMLTELSELVATGEDGAPQLNLMKETTNHIESMVRSCVSAIAKMKPIADAATADLDKMGAEEGSSTPSDSPPDEGGADDGSGGEDDMGGMDDFGGTEEPPADEAAPDENAPQEGEEEDPAPDQ